MPARKAIVETYFEGFRRSDHARILGCLTDDGVGDLAGHPHLVCKKAFDREIGNEQDRGLPDSGCGSPRPGRRYRGHDRERRDHAQEQWAA